MQFLETLLNYALEDSCEFYEFVDWCGNFDAGVLRAMPVKKASLISFWIRFETEPLPFWVQIFTSEKGVAQKLDPAALGIRKGEWKFIELPVSTFMFKPQRATVENLRALQFSPDEGLSSTQVFLLDDILIEP